MTEHTGLKRQLSSAEIVAQVAMARRSPPVVRVLLKGMGEPSHKEESLVRLLTGRRGMLNLTGESRRQPGREL